MKLRLNGQELQFIDEEELVDIHSRLVLCARMSGLKDHALDVAVARACSAMCEQIEAERAVRDTRRSVLKVV